MGTYHYQLRFYDVDGSLSYRSEKLEVANLPQPLLTAIDRFNGIIAREAECSGKESELKGKVFDIEIKEIRLR